MDAFHSAGDLNMSCSDCFSLFVVLAGVVVLSILAYKEGSREDDE